MLVGLLTILARGFRLADIDWFVEGYFANFSSLTIDGSNWISVRIGGSSLSIVGTTRIIARISRLGLFELWLYISSAIVKLEVGFYFSPIDWRDTDV